MSLFNFTKKKKEENTCSCGCGCGSVQESETKSCCCENSSGENSIKVLGSGCKNCHTLYENTKEAVKEAGASVEVEYVTDMQKVMGYGVMSMPALVINEKVVSSGRVLKASEIADLLNKHGF